MKTIVARDGESISIMVEVKDGKALFLFDNPVFARSEIESTLISTIMVPGSPEAVFESRINIYSNSSREAYARQLSLAFGKEISWVLVLSVACSTFSREYKALLEGQVKSKNEIISKQTTYLLHPFIEEGSPNILFGRGGTGKTYLTLRMAMAIASGGTFLGVRSEKRVHSFFIDYENTEQVFSDRIDMLSRYCEGYDPVEHSEYLHYFQTKGAPIYEIKEMIKKNIAKYGIGLIIIDSAALACGGAPEEAISALKYFNTLNSLGITTLTIAHESKNENHDMPFGSVFFANSARNMWNTRADQEQDEDVIHVSLCHRKSNNARLSRSYGARIFFAQDGVDVNYEQPIDSEIPLKKRIVYLLKEGALSLKEIAEEIDVDKKDQIKSRLKELKRKEIIESIDGKWIVKRKHENEQKKTDFYDIFGK